MSVRYLMPFNTDQTEKVVTDFLVVGSGIAGLFAALKASEMGQVVLLAKRELFQCNTEYAQGGIAAAIAKEDSPRLHMEDTLKAGAGLCDHVTTNILVEEGPNRVKELILLGTHFDRQGEEISLTREAAHSKRRILHAKGDATGEEIRESLVRKIIINENITVLENTFVVDLLTDKGCCYGANTIQGVTGKQTLYLARATILATGGAGHLFLNTTNPEVATGDGVAIAYRAGVTLKDMEFIQFHPTALDIPGAPRFLISEAVRGEGAYLRNSKGNRFMLDYHEQAELAPRDIVARAIVAELHKEDIEQVYLDLTHLDVTKMRKRFPNIYQTCLKYGIDFTKDYIPISPAAHYMMGGIRTDHFGATNIKHLYACGEVACTGVHGANRLASNSLLEAVVFAGRVIMALSETSHLLNLEDLKNVHIKYEENQPPAIDVFTSQLKTKVRMLMWEHGGISREKENLQQGISGIKSLKPYLQLYFSEMAGIELQNMIMLAELILKSALVREESRGGHYRVDFPMRDDKHWQKHIVLKNEEIDFCM